MNSSFQVDPRIQALCQQVTAKRPRTVIDHILAHGHVTTEELQTKYGYTHAPRAAKDVGDQGIPLETFRVRSPTSGRMIGAYRFGDPSKIVNGRIGGRKAFSKKFKEDLIAKYGAADTITGAAMEARYLQIDHRVPYEVAGDGAFDEKDLDSYMLLDASSQRAKSWSCEHCDNWLNAKKLEVCKSCYWASPEDYSHVATTPTRRMDIVWSDSEVGAYDKLRADAEAQGISIAELIKRKIDQ